MEIGHLTNQIMDQNLQYFNYLKTRSIFGNLYRKFFLYPKISSNLRGKVLDVGCGIGDMLKFQPNCIGVDINPHNVSYCKKMGLQALLFSKDNLPFDDSSFDSALLDNVLEHINQPNNLLIDIARVLKPHGHLIIGVPGLRGYESDPDHQHFYQESELAALATKTGFEIKCYFYAPLFKSEILSSLLKQYCIYSVWEKN